MSIQEKEQGADRVVKPAKQEATQASQEKADHLQDTPEVPYQLPEDAMKQLLAYHADQKERDILAAQERQTILANQAAQKERDAAAQEQWNEIGRDVKEVLANQQKLAQLICKVANESVPTLALLLPPGADTQEDEWCTTLYENLVNNIEGVVYDEAKLVFLCEGPMILKQPGRFNLRLKCSQFRLITFGWFGWADVKQKNR